jgi:translation initiation factor IF-3
MAHQEFGIRLIERVKNDLQEHSIVEQFPKMEGRQMVMVLSPKKVAVPVPKKEAAKPATPAVKKEAAKPAPATAEATAAVAAEKK